MVEAAHVTLLQRDDLVSQKSLTEVNLTTLSGEIFDVSKEGCALISLFNALKIPVTNSTVTFSDFTNDMIANDCLENGSINWNAFNGLNYPLGFSWMQDDELIGCDPVDIEYFGSWVLSGNVALIKIQSLYARDRKHFMIALGVDEIGVTCLESSSSTGDLELRDVTRDEVLGVRYLITKPQTKY